MRKNIKTESQSRNDIRYRTIDIEGTEIFYREGGDLQKPVLLLLHGYPASSHMFRNIIIRLSEHFHIIAPDLPGFGFSAIPTEDKFEYTFENYATIIALFLKKLNVKKASFYLFDYGAPILMRIITNAPKIVEMLIVQNGNIYNEGIGDVLKETKSLFDENSEESLMKLNKKLELDYTKWEYLNGVADISKIAPESYMIDQFLMERTGIKKIQLALKRNYKTNLPLYSLWQQTLKKMQPPTLIVWGENDEVFLKQGALRMHNDLENSKLIFYPTGHFALEEFGEPIATEIIEFYQSNFKK